MRRFFQAAMAVFFIVLISGLSGCAGSTSRPWDADWNPQSYAGITAVDARWTPDGKLDRVQVFQGKAGESFDVAADLNTGKVTWRGKGVLAFDGQKVRSAVEQAVSADVRKAAPGIVESIMTAIKASLGIPTIPFSPWK